MTITDCCGTGKSVCMNAADYVAERDGEILEGPTIRPNASGSPMLQLKNPKLNADGNRIAKQESPMHWA